MKNISCSNILVDRVRNGVRKVYIFIVVVNLGVCFEFGLSFLLMGKIKYISCIVLLFSFVEVELVCL